MKGRGNWQGKRTKKGNEKGKVKGIGKERKGGEK